MNGAFPNGALPNSHRDPAFTRSLSLAKTTAVGRRTFKNHPALSHSLTLSLSHTLRTATQASSLSQLFTRPTFPPVSTPSKFSRCLLSATFSSASPSPSPLSLNPTAQRPLLWTTTSRKTGSLASTMPRWQSALTPPTGRPGRSRSTTESVSPLVTVAPLSSRSRTKRI